MTTGSTLSVAGAFNKPVSEHAMRAAAYRGTPAFEELKTKIGPNAAYEVLARTAASGADPREGFSPELVKSATPDANVRSGRLAAIRAAVDYVAGNRIGDAAKSRITDEFYAAERQHMGGASTTSAVPEVASRVNAEASHNSNTQYAALMAGTHADYPGKTKDFFDARGQTAFDRAGSGGEGVRRGDYSAIAGDYDPQRGIASLTPHNFSRSPFAAAGLDYGLTRQLAAQGFSAQHIIAAAHDVKALGFNPKDKEAVKNSAFIRKFDNKPDETNKALLDYKHRLDQDEELRKLAEERKRTTDAQRRKEIDEEMKRKFEAHSDGSGVNSRLCDPRNHPHAKRSIKWYKSTFEKKFHAANHEATHKQEVADKRGQQANDALASLNNTPSAAPQSNPLPQKPTSPAKPVSLG